MSLLKDLRHRLTHIPTKVWLRLLLLMAMMGGGLALVLWTPVGDYFTQERMVEVVDSLRAAWWTPLALVAAYAAVIPFGFIPVSPLVVASGFVFGPVWGSIYSIIGMLVGGVIGYYVARLLGRDFIIQIAGPKLKRAEKVFERQGFWPLVQARFLPIPFAFIGFAAALAGVGTARFMITTVIGVLPVTVVHTYFAPKLLRDPNPIDGAIYLSIMTVFNILIGWPQIQERLRRRARLKELRQARHLRQQQRDSAS